MTVSAKSLARQCAAIKAMTGPEQCYKPITTLIGDTNRQTTGWGHYFSKGYPAQAFREINNYVLQRLTRHLQRRSQRAYRPPTGVSWYAHLQAAGLETAPAAGQEEGACGPAKDCGRQIPRKPDAGNLPVRFDEGGLNLRNHGSSAAKGVAIFPGRANLVG